MAEFVPFDPDVHTEEFVQLDTEYNTWQFNQTTEKYRVDALSIVGMTIPEIVDVHLGVLASLRPPDVIFYLLVAEGESVGMGGLRKLSDDVARIMWMYIRTDHRGRGHGRRMFDRLVEDGRKFGYSKLQLRAPKFGKAALHIYKSTGFKEIEEDSENMLPPLHPAFRSQWIDLEKKEL